MGVIDFNGMLLALEGFDWLCAVERYHAFNKDAIYTLVDNATESYTNSSVAFLFMTARSAPHFQRSMQKDILLNLLGRYCTAQIPYPQKTIG